MSISSLFSDIKTKVFGSNKPTPLAKITPLFDNEYTPDLEAGEGEFYRRLEARQSALDLYSKPLNCDVEKADTSIISGEVSIDINGYQDCKIIENYVSFMEIINYFGTPFSERNPRDLPFVVDDIQDKKTNTRESFHILMDLPDDKAIDIPLHLSTSNIW